MRPTCARHTPSSSGVSPCSKAGRADGGPRPTLQAEELRQGLVDYLTTTFALADPEAAQALTEFLADPVDGIFKGPYLRLRLPFRPAADDWRSTLGWDPGLTPYGHQAAAYARLTSLDLGPDKPRPLPTLVTTGTGSGKTEAFLHPILDHVMRANRAGVTGMKALILYPMNALANDQAQRLTTLLTTTPELSSVTAGIYTGEKKGSERTVVSGRGLITDRSVLRVIAARHPPDQLQDARPAASPSRRPADLEKERNVASPTSCSTSSTPTTARRAPTSRCCCAASASR